MHPKQLTSLPGYSALREGTKTGSSQTTSGWDADAGVSSAAATATKQMILRMGGTSQCVDLPHIVAGHKMRG